MSTLDGGEFPEDTGYDYDDEEGVEESLEEEEYDVDDLEESLNESDEVTKLLQNAVGIADAEEDFWCCKFDFSWCCSHDGTVARKCGCAEYKC